MLVKRAHVEPLRTESNTEDQTIHAHPSVACQVDLSWCSALIAGAVQVRPARLFFGLSRHLAFAAHAVGLLKAQAEVWACDAKEASDD